MVYAYLPRRSSLRNATTPQESRPRTSIIDHLPLLTHPESPCLLLNPLCDHLRSPDVHLTLPRSAPQTLSLSLSLSLSPYPVPSPRPKEKRGNTPPDNNYASSPTPTSRRALKTKRTKGGAEETEVSGDCSGAGGCIICSINTASKGVTGKGMSRWCCSRT